jgi:galactokinase
LLIKTRIIVQAPARICFFGDHQDYLGLPVIAGAINRFIKVKAVPTTDSNYTIQLLDLQEEIFIDLTQNYNLKDATNYFQSCMAVLAQKGAVFSQGYSIEISGTIPVNAGVSSSSALVVAWLRFLVQAQEGQWTVTDAQIGEWAYEAEVLYFDQPGGLMDQYTIARGGMVYIDTRKGTTTMLTPRMGTLILAESGIAKQTLSVLQNARNYAQNAIEEVKRKLPHFDLHKAGKNDYKKYLAFVSSRHKPYWYAAIHNHLITQKAKEELAKLSPDLKQLGQLMNAHQKILQECIQNTPVQMVEQLEAAQKAGALGAKIIGSGGGGCMVALTTNELKTQVIEAFNNAGSIQAYEVELTSHV